MKKVSIRMVAALFCAAVAAQDLRAATDLQMPQKSHADTTSPEPKLKGGALIDTINTGKNKYKLRRAHAGDSLYRYRDSLKTNDTIRTKLNGK